MKIQTILSLVVVFTATLLPSCATSEHAKTKDLLTSAGFQIHKPETAQQLDVYSRLPANKIESGVINGKLLYGYKDENQGVIYVGDEAEYRKYLELGIHDRIAITQLEAERMDQATRANYTVWGRRYHW